MEITYPPFESYDANKNVVGSDPDLARSLAKAMGAKASFVDTKFPNLINGLNAGHYDAIISGMYITPRAPGSGAHHPLCQHRRRNHRCPRAVI